jgi:hypothetical protein
MPTLSGVFDDQACFFIPRLNSRQELKTLCKLIAARKAQPPLLHFERALAKLRIRLKPRRICGIGGTRELPYWVSETFKVRSGMGTSRLRSSTTRAARRNRFCRSTSSG